jgi:hypothetical protein
MRWRLTLRSTAKRRCMLVIISRDGTHEACVREGACRAQVSLKIPTRPQSALGATGNPELACNEQKVYGISHLCKCITGINIAARQMADQEEDLVSDAGRPSPVGEVCVRHSLPTSSGYTGFRSPQTSEHDSFVCTARLEGEQCKLP